MVFAPILLASACVPIGPAAIRADQVDYADAIGVANQRLALSNLVKIRYGDTPTFLLPKQVVAGYSLNTNANVNANFVNEVGPAGLRFNNVTLGVTGSFSNNPTITYSPVTGANFSALMLAPISPADLFGMIMGGAPPDLVLGLGLAQINSERNRLLLRPDSAVSERRFHEIVGLMVELHEAGLLQLRIEGEGKERTPHLVLADVEAGKVEPEPLAQLRQLLELTPRRGGLPGHLRHRRGRARRDPRADPLDLGDHERPRRPDRGAARGRGGGPDARKACRAHSTHVGGAARRSDQRASATFSGRRVRERPLPRPLVLDRQYRLRLQACAVLPAQPAQSRRDRARAGPARDHHPDRLTTGAGSDLRAWPAVKQRGEPQPAPSSTAPALHGEVGFHAPASTIDITIAAENLSDPSMSTTGRKAAVPVCGHAD